MHQQDSVTTRHNKNVESRRASRKLDLQKLRQQAETPACLRARKQSHSRADGTKELGLTMSQQQHTLSRTSLL